MNKAKAEAVLQQRLGWFNTTFTDVGKLRYYIDGRGDLRSRKRDVIREIGEKFNVSTHGTNRKIIRRWLRSQITQ